VSRIACEIALSKGKWSYYPSSRRVRRKLRRILGDLLLEVRFHDSDDAIEAEVCVEDDEDACEDICDTIFRAFLEWKPEYESMIEVGILFIELSDDPFGYVQDEMDDSDKFGEFGDRIERIWL